jgi:hypothetical protein
MTRNPTKNELASYLALAERRNRLRWQADVSAPGSAGVSVVDPDDSVADVLDRIATQSGGGHA